MKKFIFTLMVSATALIVQANPRSDFNLKLYDNSVFSVVFDNACFNQANNTFSIANINPGNHYLKVYKMVHNPWNPYLQQQVVYNGWIKIPPKAEVYSYINCNFNYEVAQVNPKCGGNNNGWGNGCGNNNGWNNDNNWSNNGGWDNSGWGCGQPQYMSQQSFNQLKASIASKSFDSSKMQVAKQALSANFISSQHAFELVQLMTFESNKLDVAKFAYNRTVDKQNYYIVNNAFDFDSSIGSLNQYIANN